MIREAAKADEDDPSCRTAGYYLSHAIKCIDEHLGKGYAAAHPELVAGFMQTAARDYHTRTLDVGIDRVRDEMARIADALTAEE